MKRSQSKGNIVLIGFMGSGKTTVGGKLSHALHLRFLDADQLLEEEFGCSIRDYFAKEGEEAFREKETMLLRRMALELKDAVLATGGGMPLREENARLLRQIGTVYYLKASKETTLARLIGDDTRPLLSGGEFEEKVDRLLDARMPLYAAAADYIIETDGKSYYEIIKEVEKTWKKGVGQKKC